MTEEPTLYEAVYILDTQLAEEEVEEQAKQLEELVSEAGGEVLGTRDFRTRRLAYEIDGHTRGTYKLLYFHGDGEVVDALRMDLGMRQAVIRGRVFVANPEAIITGKSGEQQEGAEPPQTATETEDQLEPQAEDENAPREETPD